MTSYQIFSFTICFVVFVLLTAMCSMILYQLVKNQLKLIDYGDMDDEILKEYNQSKKRARKLGNVLSQVLNILITVFFIVVFAFSLVINLREDSFSDRTPTLRVVLSDSMSKKLEGNDYLLKNDLDDQFQMYDMILTYKIPDEFALELYDIVIYEVDEKLIVHRIVAIEEPNEYHPEHRYFTLQGDAVGNIDRFPVLYSQMRGIYRGERIMFLGGFVKFLQSPAGWLCLFLILAATTFSPLVDRRIDRQKQKRLLLLQQMQKTDAAPEYTAEGEDDFDFYLILGTYNLKGKMRAKHYRGNSRDLTKMQTEHQKQLPGKQ